ncbi:multiheme c-type cytochrome [Anaeromyxobacter diazotrophicus]|uniref:Outer membrane cytochrome MtrC/MtrF-like domain-containing protein n=1 Tax=Anaeromyxobacter diazotrophicus TaxID=2590199 RepID=A0A7I9VLQ2_9BACT|nr:hypothetical protein [Anaeromyxobacter diazotrophicus]GEJ57039.1 hypothetical protein AMYX_17800 [Anaeromyxobacter diazotrophicus]
MTTTTTCLRFALIAALAGGLAAGCKSARRISGDTHEEARPSLFTHEKHSSVDCVDCHTEIAQAKRLGEAKLPPVSKCEECHPDLANPTDDTTRNAAAAAASLAHRPARDYQLTFDHEGHLKRLQAKDVNQACARCHKDLPEAGVVRDVTPTMATCTSCHHHQQDVALARCSPCHVSLRRYPLKPIEALAAISHQGNWIRGHGGAAKNGAETCAQCHDQTYCATCHTAATVPFRPEIRFPERVEADFIHRGDYVSRHQMEAAADPASCRKCHGSFFCDSCHRAQNLSSNLVAGGNPNNPHPLGWANDKSKGSAFHGNAARNNIIACAGCHDQGAASICTTCHRSFGPGQPGLGGNPHPGDFRLKHSRADIRKNGMCLACHTAG